MTKSNELKYESTVFIIGEYYFFRNLNQFVLERRCLSNEEATQSWNSILQRFQKTMDGLKLLQDH